MNTTGRGTPGPGPQTQELMAVLDELASVLAGDGDTHWTEWVREARAQLLNDDGWGVDRLLAAYGGMGSLSDVVLANVYKDGVSAWKPGHIELNEKFAALRTKAWELATAIQRSRQ